jgi:hypothetical protein
LQIADADRIDDRADKALRTFGASLGRKQLGHTGGHGQHAGDAVTQMQATGLPQRGSDQPGLELPEARLEDVVGHGGNAPNWAGPASRALVCGRKRQEVLQREANSRRSAAGSFGSLMPYFLVCELNASDAGRAARRGRHHRAGIVGQVVGDGLDIVPGQLGNGFFVQFNFFSHLLLSKKVAKKGLCLQHPCPACCFCILASNACPEY